MGKFKTFLEILNPQMYDLTTARGKKEYEDDLADLARWKSQPQKQEVRRDPFREPIVIQCRTGCDKEHLDRLTVEQGQGYRVLDGSKSRSRAIWFFHQFQPEGLEKDREILITYPLSCTTYYDRVHYTNGEDSIEPSKEMSNKVQVYVECPWRILGTKVVNLPLGWTFSEEGHILCETRLRISNDMIHENERP
jgi:hypothetical protein